MPHVTRDVGLNNLAALLNAAPLDLLPDRITTLEGYSALMRWVATGTVTVWLSCVCIVTVHVE